MYSDLVIFWPVWCRLFVLFDLADWWHPQWLIDETGRIEFWCGPFYLEFTPPLPSGRCR